MPMANSRKLFNLNAALVQTTRDKAVKTLKSNIAHTLMRDER